MAFLNNNNTKKSKFFIVQPITISNSLKLIQYAFSGNRLVTKRSIINLYKYLNLINEDVAYEDDYMGLYYFRFLKIICNLRVEKDLELKISTVDTIISYIKENYKEDEIPEKVIEECLTQIESLQFAELSNAQVEYFSEWVQNKLQYTAVFSNIPELKSIISDIESDNQRSNKDLVNRMVSTFSNIFRELNKSKANSKHSADDFSTFNDSSLSHAVTNMYDKYTSNSNKLITGYQKFNEMINGGFEGSRQYIFFGLPKSFKSGTLLNMALSICKNNKGYQTKDISKRPVVVYLTMENDVNETLQRIWFYLTGDGDLKKYKPEEIKNLIREFTEDTGIGIKVLFRPHRSVSTDYLYEIIDDMALDNEECICMIQDYTKRIRSSSNIPDLRLELGEIVNEFSVFSKEFDIPVITAAQLNRDAYRIMENMKNEGRRDIAKLLGSSQIGESALIVENTDYGIIVNREDIIKENEPQVSYLTFKIVASRAKDDSGVKYFAQPFENGLKLAEDINSDHSFAVESISSAFGEEPTKFSDIVDNEGKAKNIFSKNNNSGYKPQSRPRNQSNTSRKTKETESYIVESSDEITDFGDET